MPALVVMFLKLAAEDVKPNRAYCRPRQRAAVEYVGWRRFGRALGSYRRPSNSRSSPMERPVGATALGAKPFLWRVGALWRAGGPDLLGLRSRERCL
jgi:hypothetical protein